MPLILTFDGHPGQRFAEVVRHLPDGRDWLVSDPDGRVVIARREGDVLLKEAILSASADEDGAYEIECLASRGVSEGALAGLVLAAIGACLCALLATYLYGPGGPMGLLLGLVLSAVVPSGVLALGQATLDPGRERQAEAQMERAFRFAIAQVGGARLRTSDPA